ncbi:MAG: hypothetical protein OHK0017_04990 [Patescibacteria group bacterium]
MELFALYLGGKAPNANIEQHDVVFWVTSDLKSDYDHIKSLWFGSPEGVHIDAIAKINGLEGYRVILKPKTDLDQEFEVSKENALKLFFINFGADGAGKFTEIHESGFFVAENKTEAIKKAKSKLLKNESGVHLDDLYSIDDCLVVNDKLGFEITLEPSEGYCIEIENCYTILR